MGGHPLKGKEMRFPRDRAGKKGIFKNGFRNKKSLFFITKWVGERGYKKLFLVSSPSVACGETFVFNFVLQKKRGGGRVVGGVWAGKKKEIFLQNNKRRKKKTIYFERGKKR